MNDLSNQTNAQVSEQKMVSGGYGNIGEGIKLMELHVCALGRVLTMRPKKWGHLYPELGQDSFLRRESSTRSTCC